MWHVKRAKLDKHWKTHSVIIKRNRIDFCLQSCRQNWKTHFIAHLHLLSLSLIHYFFFYLLVWNFVLLAWTDLQYYSSSFFLVLPSIFENSFLFCWPSPGSAIGKFISHSSAWPCADLCVCVWGGEYSLNENLIIFLKYSFVCILVTVYTTFENNV